MISCSAFCTSGINKRQKRGGDHPDQHHGFAADVVGYRREREAADAQHQGGAAGEPSLTSACGQMQRLPWPAPAAELVIDQIVALDKADEGEDGDYHDVISAERDAVEFVAEHMAGGRRGPADQANFCHGDLPDRSDPGTRGDGRDWQGRRFRLFGLKALAFADLGRYRYLSSFGGPKAPPGRRVAPVPVQPAGFSACPFPNTRLRRAPARLRSRFRVGRRSPCQTAPG